jgi:GAF domain-containing protein
MADHELLTYAVSEFARTLGRGSVLSDVLNDLAERVTAALGVAGAGVSLVESGQCRFAAASDGRAATLERLQETVDAGPCLEACLAGKAVTVSSLAENAREWGAYRRAAQEAGIVAVAAVPMCHDGQSVGTVNLYDVSPRVWSAEDLYVAGILADMATGYVVQAWELDRQRRINEQLREALDSRIVIEQAKGALAAERHISVDEAFNVLRRHARGHSASLRSVAEAVVNLGLRP